MRKKHRKIQTAPVQTTSAETPKISIVVPVYNDAEYLRTCMDSLVNQTLKDIEILATDDASTDDSLRILREYAERDSRVRVFSFTENRSAFQARNMGIRHASGEYIMFADGDDYLELDACERVWKLEQENPVDILHFGTDIIKYGEIEMGKNTIDPQECYLWGDDVFSAFLKGQFTWTLWNKAYRRELCKNILSKCENLVLPKAQDKYFVWMAAYLSQSYRGYPYAQLYHYRFGLGVEGSSQNTDLKTLELFCKKAWVENAIATFMKNNTEGRYESDVQSSRRHGIGRCVTCWRRLPEEDKLSGLTLLQNYWTKPGDLGEIVGAFCRFFKDKQGELADLLYRVFDRTKQPLGNKPIRTIGTYYHIYSNGGIQRVISKLMPIWLALGYRVVFFTDFSSEEDYAVPEGVIRVKCAFSARDAAKNYADRGLNLERLLREYEIDVMIYNAYLGPSLLWDLLLCRFMQIPFLTYHHSVFSKYLISLDAKFYLIPKTVRLGSGVIVLSEVDRNFWKYAAPNLPVYQVNNPLTFDLESIPCGDLDDLSVVWVGRLDEIAKRFFDPVSIMQEVLKRIPNAKLFMVGGDESGVNFNRLKAKITKLGLEESIILCGFQKDVFPYYQKASVFLMTSSHEGFCMSLAEAMSFGLPVVMYNLPYLTLVHGNQGILSVPQKNIKAAANEICALLQDQAYRQTIGRLGRKFLENLCDKEKLAESWKQIFEAISQPTVESPKSEIDQLLIDTLLEHYRLAMEGAKGSGNTDKHQTGNDLLRLLFGNRDLNQFAELRSGGPNEKRTISFITEIGGKKAFNVLINSDGSRNWITPEELKKALAALNAKPKTPSEVDFEIGDTSGKQNAGRHVELRASGPDDKRALSLVTQTNGRTQFHALLNSDGTRNWITPDEMQTILANAEKAWQRAIDQKMEDWKTMEYERVEPSMENTELIFGIGDKSEGSSDSSRVTLRSYGKAKAKGVAFVTSKNGTEKFNVLINSEGNRNWVIPDELRRLEQTVADLTEQINELRQLCAAHGILPEAIPEGEP